MMRLVSLGLALAALGAALFAAWQWRRASQSDQLSPVKEVPEMATGRDADFIQSITARAASAAAVWTGVAVVLGALSSVVGALSLGLTPTPTAVAPQPTDHGSAQVPVPSSGSPSSGGSRAAMLQTCRPDFEKLCPDARPGPGGAIAACIKQNHDSFSDPCKAAIAEMRVTLQAQSAAMRQSCRVDFQKFCPDARPGPGGAIAACIKQNHDSFSDTCRAAIAEMRAQQRPQRNAGPGPGSDLDSAPD